MSYNKNTVNHSHIGTIAEVLNDLGIPCTISNIGEVEARGVNDCNSGIATRTMRELRYKGFIVLERMHRTPDCDSDDVIMSHKYKLSYYEQIMQNDKWKIEI